VGQESNILTSKGVRKFLTTNKMKEEHAYRKWIMEVLLPKLMHDPLEIGTEVSTRTSAGVGLVDAVLLLWVVGASR